jgi:hypothetical protein
MLSKETNLYYFPNQGKYYGSSKELKWVDVSMSVLFVQLSKKGVKLGTFVSSD